MTRTKNYSSKSFDSDMSNDKRYTTRIIFDNKNLTHLDSNIFQGYDGLNWINYSSNQITQLDLNIFQGLTSLWEINFSSNHLTQLDSGLFQGLNSLRSIDFSSNRIETLDSNLFQAIKSLNLINFGSNHLTQLDPDLLRGLVGLNSINFSSNHLTQLNSDILQGLNRLWKVDFSQNQITQLDSNIFRGLTSLRSIDFSSNLITRLDSGIFQGLSNLENVNFSSNQITQLDSSLFQGVKSLNSINFSSNQITQLGGNIFRGLNGLRLLDFSSNQIAKLDSSLFQGLASLWEINFSSNLIVQLDSNTFDDVRSLRFVNFSNNKLTSLASCPFSSLVSVEVILLNSNFCSRIASDFFSPFKKLQEVDFRFDYFILDSISDYVSIFKMFFSVHEAQEYDYDSKKYKFSAKFRANAFFNEFLNMYCLSKNVLTFPSRSSNVPLRLDELFSSDSKLAHFYGRDFTPVDFILQIRPITNKTITNLLKHAKYVFNSYELTSVHTTDFQLRSLISIHSLCVRNSQLLLDEIGDFFYVKDFAECFQATIEEDSEMVAIFLFNLFTRRIFHDQNLSTLSGKLEEFNYFLTDFKKYRFLERCSDKKWWTLFGTILDFIIKPENSAKKLPFFLLFENWFKANSDDELKTCWTTIENASSNHLLHYVASSGQSRLIKHPTNVEFLHLKWKNLPAGIYYSHLVLFLLLIVSYSVNVEYLREQNSPIYAISRYISISLVSIFLLEECVQIFVFRANGLRIFSDYLKSSQNLLELIYPICLVFLCIDSLPIKTASYSLIILFLYAILIVRLEKFPVIGIYVTVFKKILSRSVKVLPLILLASLAFLFSFRINSLRLNTELGDEYRFNGSFSLTLIHLMTLNLGDFENDKMGLSSDIDGSNWLIYIIYSMFLFIIPILIVNIFIGISVDEMKKLIDQSQEYNTIIKIEYTLKMQDALCGVGAAFRRIRPIHVIIGRFISWGVLIDEKKFAKKVANSLETTENQSQVEDASKSKWDILELKMTELNTDMEQMEKRLNNNMSKEVERLNGDNQKMISSIENLTQNTDSSQNVGPSDESANKPNDTWHQLGKLEQKFDELSGDVKKIKKRFKEDMSKVSQDNQRLLASVEHLTKLMETLNSNSQQISIKSNEMPPVDST